MANVTKDVIMNWWLGKFYNTNIKEVIEAHPEEIKSPDWFKLYPVTKEQHDEWYDWAIDYISKKTRRGKKITKKLFALDYLNCAPYFKVE